MPKSREVDAWFKKYDNPMKATMMKVRDIILGADPRMSECIKWQSPTFTYEGNLASFNPRSKAHASLLFHTGAKIPGRHPRLQGGGDTARYMNFKNVPDANVARSALKAVVKAWIEMKDDGAGPGTKKRKVKKKTGKKTGKKQAKKKKAARVKRKPARKKAKKKAVKKKTVVKKRGRKAKKRRSKKS